MAYSCPIGNTPKPISIDDDSMLRKDGNGTSLVAIAKHPAIHTKAERTQTHLGTIKKWMIECRYHWHLRLGSNGIYLVDHVVEPSIDK